MNTIKAHITDIIWDTDGENVLLPKTVSITIEPEEMEDADISNEDYISDLLTELYEYCVKSFTLTVK